MRRERGRRVMKAELAVEIPGDRRAGSLWRNGPETE